VVFNAVHAGEHYAHVRRAGNEIAGSPFVVLVSESEVACVEGVKVYGRGLTDGQTGQPCQFFINTADAGHFIHTGHLCLSISLSVCSSAVEMISAPKPSSSVVCPAMVPLICPSFHSKRLAASSQTLPPTSHLTCMFPGTGWT